VSEKKITVSVYHVGDDGQPTCSIFELPAGCDQISVAVYGHPRVGGSMVSAQGGQRAIGAKFVKRIDGSCMG
jgi:hypothetical protein